MFCFVFFKQKTAYEMRISDWSSDVCASDLEVADLLAIGAADVPAVERVAQRRRMDGRQGRVDQPGAFQLAQDRHDAARAMDVLHMHVILGRGDLAEAGNAP